MQMRIAAYCRVSTEKEEQLDSLEHQKEFFEEYAVKNGHELVRLYADEGISGTSLKKRDEFMRLLYDAKLGLFDMVVVKDVSRLARNTVDFLQSIRTLKGFGINTLFLTSNMDSLGESEFVLTLFGAMAQEESANLSKRVKFGKKITAKKGRVPQRIFGYDRIDNFTLSVNEKEAQTVREIYRLYLEEGLGCRKISMKLNELGLKTKFNCEWNPRGVRRVLENPIYSGHYINHKYEIEDYLSGKQVQIPKDQHFHHDRPEWAIISPETFAKTQKQLEARRRKYNSGEPFMQARYSNKHIFSTLIKCEHCGRSFTRKVHKYANTYFYWVCPTNYQYTAEKCGNKTALREDILLAEIKEYLASLIQDRDDFINKIIEELEKQNRIKCGKIAVSDIEMKRRRLIAKKERYQEMYANDAMTMTELKERTGAIAEELAELDYRLKQHEQMTAIQNSREKLMQRYMRDIEEFLNLETATNIDMRSLISHITVNKDKTVEIVLKKFDVADLR